MNEDRDSNNIDSGEGTGLVHRIRPFDTNYEYIPDLERCGGRDDGGNCFTGKVNNNPVLNKLANDTSFCKADRALNYEPNVNNVTESLRVLDDPDIYTNRHWSYAAFYEPEGWTTELRAPLIKGVRRLSSPLQALSDFHQAGDTKLLSPLF